MGQRRDIGSGLTGRRLITISASKSLRGLVSRSSLRCTFWEVNGGMARIGLETDFVAGEPTGEGQCEMREVTEKTGLRASQVLLVGYDDVVTGALNTALGADCAISRAANPQEAVSELRRHRTDVLLMDYHASNGSDPRFAESASQAGIPVLWMHADPLEVQALGEIIKALARAARRS